MASAGPTEENTRFLKWMLLLVEGGTLVLREYFNKVYPPLHLAQLLVQKTGRIKVLVKNGNITPAQYDLLFPQHGSPNSDTFDITLLICLLRNICGLNQNSPAWTTTPSSTDSSPEADMSRLRAFRNECAHSTKASMTEKAFRSKWTDLEQVLLRLGRGIPGLKAQIDAMGTQSIDPAREKILLNTIEAWENVDDKLQRDVEEIKSEIQVQSNTVQELSNKYNTEQTQIKDCMQEIQNVTFPAMRRELNKCKRSSKQHSKSLRNLQNNVFTTQRRVKELSEMKKKMIPEITTLVSNTDLYMRDTIGDSPYVETHFHQKAKQTVMEHNVLVISGHPGEGKTTMAVRLMSEITSSDRCLKMVEPSDWKYFDLGLGKIDVLFADDLFGPGSIDDRLVKEWGKFLPDIYRATQNGRIKVIFTTRHSILEDAKDLMHPSPIFDDKHVILLSSGKLSDSEKYGILEVHLQKNQRLFRTQLISECINASGECFITESPHGPSSIVFGFPQCVSMFASNERLFQRKEKFFSRPSAFFRRYIEELFKVEVTLLSLVLVWSRPEKQLLLSELGLTSTSHELKRIAKKFGFHLKPKIVKTVRKVLDVQTGGLIVFNPRTGGYTFSHHTIEDMIGLVICRTYPEQTLELSSRDFVVNYVTIDNETLEQDHFLVQPYLYKKLGEKMLRLFLDPNKPFSGSALKRFQREGKCPNTITPTFDIDGSLIYMSALKSKDFINAFIDVLEDEKHRDSAIKLLSLPVMKMSGHFLGRGIYIEETVVTLPDYLLLRGQSLFLEQLIKRKTSMKLCADKRDIYLSLMIATHSRKKSFVKFLLECSDVVVTDEIIYIAAMTKDIDLLKMLLDEEKTTEGKTRICNGNTALTSTAKKGLASTVKCLVQGGEDVTARNSDKYTALGKAIIYKQVEVCMILIKAGSPLNDRIGTFKRTPLHIACDMGLPQIVHLLLENGACPKLKDQKGHFPIHCAAFRNHIDVIEVLLKHDLTLAQQRIVSYRKKSCVKGMTVFHVAIMKEYESMIEKLLEMEADPNVQDYFGRTPLFYATSIGEVPDSLVRVSDINKSEKQGLTPLHMAMLKGDSELADRFVDLREDINVNAVDKWGRTPIHIAFERGQIGFGIILILLHNADIRMVTNDGNSVIHILEKKRKKYFFEGDSTDNILMMFPDVDVNEGQISVISLLKAIDLFFK